MSVDPDTRQALLDLHARYAFTIDDGDAEAWAACFTPDGVLETTRPLLVSGTAELTAFARARAVESKAPARHVTWHETFAQAPNGQISARCSAALVETRMGGVVAVFTATYLDTFVKGIGGWMIGRRRVLIDLPESVVPD
jgi:3-phenylpropionate/cinnamic acid dioxygenase small subunit